MKGAIQARGLCRSFGEKVALAPIDLDVGPGGVTGLLGPNGSGKSTLLRTLIGLVRKDAGAASIDGAELAGDGLAVRRRATYAPGELHLYGEMRADEQLEWLLRGRGKAALARGRELADGLGLPLEARVGTFSHGMKRQLLFSAAMAPDVRVRLLDEPTDGLDPSKRARVVELLLEDAARGTTLFVSSHHLGEVDRICDRLLFMRAGELLADESGDQVAERARRIVRVRFAPTDTPIERDVRAAVEPHVERCELEGDRLLAHLKEADPRPLLGALAACASLPPPASVQYGELSLEDLYREIYGVEGF